MIKDTHEYEEQQKEVIYDKIGEIVSENYKVINEIEEMGQYIDINERVPNIGVTLNNKISEISQQFEKSGVSLFVQNRNGFPMPNYVGTAIISDLVQNGRDAMGALLKYNASTEKAVHKRTKGPLRKIMFYIKSIIFNSAEMANENETEEINSHLSEYGQINEKIYGYNLRDNIVSTLARQVISEREINSKIGVSDKDRLEYDIVPTLKALGLGDLIPELAKELGIDEKEPKSIEQKKSWDLGNWGINVDEFRKGTSEIVTENTEKGKDETLKTPSMENEI